MPSSSYKEILDACKRSPKDPLLLFKLSDYAQLRKDVDLKHPAVYFLLGSKPVTRLCDKDPNGILYIGKGMNVDDRINRLCKFIEGNKTRDHSAGARYSWLSAKKRMPKEYAKEHLFIASYRLSPHNGQVLESLAKKIKIASGNKDNHSLAKELSKGLEYKLLSQYFEDFGELPPLNSSINLKGKDSVPYIVFPL